MTHQSSLSLRRKHTSAAQRLAYNAPLDIVRGEGTYLFDKSGRRYIDCVNNVCHVGHCHPHVVEAAARQMALLNTNTRYLHDNLTHYAQRLTSTMPDGLDVCFFVNSGSEANDLALRLARCYTSRHDVCVIDHAYHGNSSSLIGISPYKFDSVGGEGSQSKFVRVAPSPDTYRGMYRKDDPQAAKKYADAVALKSEGAACFICESLPGCAGQIIPPPGFLASAFEHVRTLGGVSIADEVQVGFGRVGSGMWAFDAQDAHPDIVTLGKPMGNGHPLGAVVTTRAIADAFDNGMEFFNTFGGNPVSCAVGLAVLDVIENEQVVEHAANVGAHLMTSLETLKATNALIGDIRGMGLFIGIELVRDRNTLDPAADEATAIIEAMKARGILLSTDGPLHNVIKIKPPMVFSKANADEVIGNLSDVLAAT